MPYLAYPLMSDRSAVTQPEKSGVWTLVEQADFLLQSAEGLQINWDAATAAQQTLLSTPDVWAQVAMFEADLIFSASAAADSHAGARHTRALGEWRGLLALLALSHSIRLGIGGSLIDLKALSRARGGMQFGQVAFQLRPADVAFEQLSWDAVSALKIGNGLVGLINPATLVAPVKEYAGAIGAQVPWFRNGRLVDPCIPAVGLTRRQHLILQIYLTALRASLLDFANGGTSAEVLLQLLEDYRDNCRERASGEDPGQVLELDPLTTVPLPPGQPPYAELIRVWRGVRTEPPEFSTMLGLRREVASRRGPDGAERPLEQPFKGVLLIDSKAENRAGIAFWGDVTLEAMLTNQALRKDVEERAAREGYVCHDADAFFTDKLYEIGNGGIAGHGDGVREYLLPIAPWLMMFLPPDDLRTAVTIQQTPDGGKIVTLTLQLWRGNTRTGALTQYKHSFSREYRRDVDIWRRNAPPAVSIWPNFVSLDWRFYYVFYGGRLGPHFSLRGPAQGAALLDSLVDVWRRSNGELRQIKGWLASPALMPRRLETLQQNNIVNELFYQRVPIEGLICDCVPDEANNRFVPPQARTVVGILLPPRAVRGQADAITEVVTSDKKMRIGVDFGSSNTTVYRELDSKPEPVVIQPRVVNLLQDMTDSTAWNNQHRLLMPVKKPPTPFMTILRSRSGDAEIEDVAPLFKDHLYFIDDGPSQMQTILERPSAGHEALHFYLKWRRERVDRQRASRFLRQTMLMALAEAVADGIKPTNITWLFSYPEAFKRAELDDLMIIYSGQLGELLQMPPKEVKLDRRTESEAAALYFNDKEKAFLSQTMIVLDVGGGTTDIAIWHDGKFLWRNSIKVAGSNILLPFLSRRPDLVTKLAEDSSELKEMVRDWIAKASASDANNALEVIINQPDFSKAMQLKLAMSTGHGEGLLLLQVVQTAYAGFLYYVGLQLRALGDKVALPDGSTVRVCFAGRGSLLFRDVLGGRTDGLASTTRILAAAAGKNFNTEVVFTDDAKHEVAYGLVVDRQIDDSQRERHAVLGEAIRADDRSLGALESTRALTGREKLRVDPKLPSTMAFAAMLKEFASIELPIKSLANDIVGLCEKAMSGDSVAGSPAEMAGAKPDTSGSEAALSVHDGITLVEPPFASTLRALITLINRPPTSTAASTRR